MVKRLLAGLLLTVAMGVGSLALSGVAHAQDTTTCATYGCGPTSPGGPANSLTTTPAAQTQAATDGPYTSSSSLAFTGTDVIGTVILGLVLVGGGVIIVRVSRRRRTHA